MKAKGVVALGVALMLVGSVAAAEGGPEPVDLKDAPVNQWVRLKTSRETGYTYSQPIYVPSRKQVLHWGGVFRVGATARNDVRAFDVTAGNWASDYPIAEKCPFAPRGHGAAPLGVTYYGSGVMHPSGTPYPSAIVNGVCTDSKRDQVIYTMKGLMAAYDPKTRKWRDMKARTIIDGRAYPGGPPAYGLGTCYDPVNDEIVLFPHWSGAGDPKNTDLLEITGEISGHLGTFVYSFKDNAWRRVSHAFGSEDARRARKAVIDLMAGISRAVDGAWDLRRRPDEAGQAEVAEALAAAVAKAESLVDALPATAVLYFDRALPPLRAAAASAKAGTFDDASRSGALALRVLGGVLDKPLRVEPPARCAAPMVYDPKNKVIVMFGGHSGLVRSDIVPQRHLGGHPGALSDTWLYDCTTKQWRELRTVSRPPAERCPKVVYDPASGLVLLATWREADGRRKIPAKATIWALDVAKAEWTKRHEQAWPWPVSVDRTYAARTPLYDVGLDEKHGVLLMVQNVGGRRDAVQETYAMRLDISKMKATPVPAWRPPPPIKPQVIPPADPTWVAKLKSLPANTWVRAKPPQEAVRRDWGSAACDPVRGHVYYFGGGHATYQVNDVAIYAVGANRWVHAAGDHNDFVPPVGWGGVTMGFRGGRHAHHQRNQYVAIDGRMYVAVGCARYPLDRKRDIRTGYAWFYDVNRRGVWRMLKVAEMKVDKGLAAPIGGVHVVDPAGRVIGISGEPAHYYSRTYTTRHVNIYDVHENRLEVRKVPKPYPERVGECRPFCFVSGRNQVFLYEFRAERKTGKVLQQGTWVYDITVNRFLNMKPRGQQPPGIPLAVESIDGQDAVLAVILTREKGAEQWVYSFRHNAWAPLPLKAEGEAKPRFQRPYGQVVSVARYGVVVNLPGTWVMRPDVSTVRWE